MKVASLLPCALLLAGCASTVQTVDHEMLLQPGTAQYRMDELELFVMPLELDAPLPVFPEAVTATEVAPVTACAEAWLSEDGDVTHVAAVHGLPGCDAAGEASAPFAASVLDALSHWSFTPPMVCRFREDQRAQREAGDCRGDVEVRRVPVRLAYAFRFERRAGRAAVGSRRLPE
jgi:hypothetical protein